MNHHHWICPRARVTALLTLMVSVILLTAADCGGSGSTTPPEPPNAPSNVQATAGDGQVTISWDSVSSATSYNLYFATEAGVSKDNSTQREDVTSPHTEPDLDNNTTYHFVVTAVNDDGESALSDEVEATPLSEDDPDDKDDPDDEGVLLEGDPDSPAALATRDLYIPIEISEDEVERDPDLGPEAEVLRTELEVIFNLQATIAEVNDLLERFDARIVSMLTGVPGAIIRFPDPGSIAALDDLIAQMEADPAIVLVVKSVIVEEPDVDNDEGIVPLRLPSHLKPHEAVDMQRIDHHLAIRGHAAWNAHKAITNDLNNRPWLIIADFFGDGTPTDGYAGQFTAEDFASGNSHSHGYHVLGIIAGDFDAPETISSSERRAVTGIMPEPLRIRAVDVRAGYTGARLRAALIRRMIDVRKDNPNTNIVVNTSLGSRLSNAQIRRQALVWTQQVRLTGTIWLTINPLMDALTTPGSGLEGRFIHFTSAGNGRGNDPDRIALYNSDFAYAAMGDEMEIPLQDPALSVPIPHLINTFVVENRVNTAHDPTQPQRPLPGCAWGGVGASIMGGTLSGIGTEVWSFSRRNENWNDSREARSTTGTSMATPQAAGLAAYAWAVNPGLTVPELVALMAETTEARRENRTPGFTCNDTYPQPVIDAYAAVLRAGGDNARRALLDVTNTGQFDLGDIERFLEEFEKRKGTLDYSRFDLNGSGRTGGDATERFDLNDDGQYAEIIHLIEDEEVTLNESALTDLDILCYYAYSPLYTGDTSARKERLADECLTTVIIHGAPERANQVRQGAGPTTLQVKGIGFGKWLSGELRSGEENRITAEILENDATSGLLELDIPQGALTGHWNLVIVHCTVQENETCTEWDTLTVSEALEITDITVGPNGEDQREPWFGTPDYPFATLNHAVELSNEGDTLRITEGIIPITSVEIPHRTVRGASPVHTILQGPGNGMCLIIDVPYSGSGSPNTRIAELTVQGCDVAIQVGPNHTPWVHIDSVTLTENVVGVRVQNEQATVSASHASIFNSRLVDNTSHGALAEGIAHLTLANATIIAGNEVGIGLVEGSVAFGGALPGIVIGDLTEGAYVSGNLTAGLSGSGIAIVSGHSSFDDNRDGIVLEGHLRNGHQGRFSVSNNTNHGIWVKGNVVLQGGDVWITHNGGTGLHVESDSNTVLQISGNSSRIAHNNIGISGVTRPSDGRVVLNNVTVEDNTSHGVTLNQAHWEIVLSDSSFSHNGGDGLHSSEWLRRLVATNTRFVDNAGNGLVSGPRRLLVRGSSFEHNGGDGIRIHGSQEVAPFTSRPILEGEIPNTFVQNGGFHINDMRDAGEQYPISASGNEWPGIDPPTGLHTGPASVANTFQITGQGNQIDFGGGQ